MAPEDFPTDVKMSENLIKGEKSCQKSQEEKVFTRPKVVKCNQRRLSQSFLHFRKYSNFNF